MRRVLATIVAVENSNYYMLWVCVSVCVCVCVCVCVFSFSYSTCNAHEPYCNLWPAPALQNLSTLSHKRHNSRKKKAFEYKMCVLIFCTTFVWNISHAKKNWARYDQKRSMFFMYSTHYSCPILIKLKFSRQVFEKCSNTKFHENPSNCSWIVPCGQTDGRTDEQPWRS